jgi:sugar phosphate isomerase/epimerase
MPIGPGEPAAIDLKGALKALIETGFDHWVSVEPFDYNPDPTTVARTAIRVLKDALAAARG